MKPLLLAVSALLFGVSAPGRWALPQASSAAQSGAAGGDDVERIGPHPEPVDFFHPDRERAVSPAYGGTVTVHLENLPPSVNSALENSQVARNVLNELHAWLVRRNWESWEFEPELCTGWDTEDTLVPSGVGTPAASPLYGRVSDAGERWSLTPVSPQNPLLAPRELPKAEVLSIERGTVYTLHLREGVRWHDGQPFDANDVLFSWRIAQNPLVRCDWCRPYLQKIVRAEVLDPHTIRFFFGEQYFNALSVFADDFCILPAHLYDLRDPDHPRFDPGASDEACAREINENPHNTEWIGLGPYRLTSFSQQAIEAERWEGFFDPQDGGYFDRIRWRHIPNDEAAFQALLNGELDFTVRISSDQYFGAATAQEAFGERFYKGYFYLGSFNYVPWNLRRPILQDLRVRKALAHALDLDTWVRTVAHGLAKMPTGPQCYFGPAYDHGVQRLAFDLERARELLAEAGWYDRDGDGLIDRDGRPFELEMLTQAGNKSAELFAAYFAGSLERLGIRLEITPLEWASYIERIRARDFDCGQMNWSVDATENDPIQLWHSGGAPAGVRGSNHPGVADPRVDELIAKGDRELDDEQRWAIWRELHRYLYEQVQPYLYRELPPRKFALSKSIRGVQFFKVNPGYSIRRWFYPSGTSGTRPTRSSR